MATQQRDNEPFIAENQFRTAFAAAKKKFPHTREDFARRTVFRMCELIWTNEQRNPCDRRNFHQLKSMVISELGVFGNDRSGYHSFLTRYSNLGGFKMFHSAKRSGPKKKPLPSITPDTQWNLIRDLCIKEQQQRAEEAGETRLDPEWAPEYEGTIW